MHGHMSVKFHRRYVLTGNALEALSFWFWILLRTVDEQTVCQPLPHTHSTLYLTMQVVYLLERWNLISSRGNTREALNVSFQPSYFLS